MRRNWWLTIIITAALVALGVACVPLLTDRDEANPIPHRELLRFHVLANSDSSRDQAIKLMVRDAILQKTGELFKGLKDADEARAVSGRNLKVLEATANRVIADAGESYRAKAVTGIFEFPRRQYGDLVLPPGEYSGVRVLLGKAEGHNWWCVLFPPLCFRDFDSGFAISKTQKVSAKGILAGYAKKAKAQRIRPTIRFALRSLDRQDNPSGARLVMGKKGKR